MGCDERKCCSGSWFLHAPLKTKSKKLEYNVLECTNDGQCPPPSPLPRGALLQVFYQAGPPTCCHGKCPSSVKLQQQQLRVSSGEKIMEKREGASDIISTKKSSLSTSPGPRKHSLTDAKQYENHSLNLFPKNGRLFKNDGVNNFVKSGTT